MQSNRSQGNESHRSIVCLRAISYCTTGDGQEQCERDECDVDEIEAYDKQMIYRIGQPPVALEDVDKEDGASLVEIAHNPNGYRVLKAT